jgi:hypothetical protein
MASDSSDPVSFAKLLERIPLGRIAEVEDVTGPVLFFSDAGRYSNNPAFRIKMALLVAALAFQFTLHRKQTGVTAVVSMLLWTAVVIGGRAIADFDV